MIEPIEASNTETNKVLLRRMTDGDLNARDDLIVRNLPLVRYYVDGFIRRNSQYSYLRDDLIGDATLKLVRAVNSLQASDEGDYNVNPTFYFARAIQTSINDSIAKSPLIHTTRSTTNVPATVICDLDTFEDCTCDPFNVVDLHELVMACCHTDEQCLIVQMRLEQYTFDAIAKQLGIKKCTVKQRLYAVRDEVYARLGYKSR
jgi:RNA polymerase sigma factor (sigma-70 family)